MERFNLLAVVQKSGRKKEHNELIGTRAKQERIKKKIQYSLQTSFVVGVAVFLSLVFFFPEGKENS